MHYAIRARQTQGNFDGFRPIPPKCICNDEWYDATPHSFPRKICLSPRFFDLFIFDKQESNASSGYVFCDGIRRDKRLASPGWCEEGKGGRSASPTAQRVFDHDGLGIGKMNFLAQQNPRYLMMRQIEALASNCHS
jgi:hypothetical protein